MLDWISFNESKNYGDLYHSIWRIDSSNELVNIIKSILENGIKFSNDPKSNYKISRGFYKFLKTEYYYISVTRDKKTISEYPVTFVLDGESISNNYKIEPFNLNAPIEIKSTKAAKNMNMNHINLKPSQILKKYNMRWAAEEKIINNRNKEGFLSTKYIKEIIFNKPDQHLVDFINELDIDIKLTIKN
jgi:hypothetical protein